MGRTTFRETEKALEKINAYTKKHKVSKSLAINQMLEAHELEKPQLEQREGEYFSYPPFLYCPDSKQWLTKETVLTECGTCRRKKTCPAWQLKRTF